MHLLSRLYKLSQKLLNIFISFAQLKNKRHQPINNNVLHVALFDLVYLFDKTRRCYGCS